jgi:hypothetical protein
MPRQKYTCGQCGESVPLYSAHKKCDRQKSFFDKVFSQTQNRWMWQCKECLKVDRGYKDHHCPGIKANLDIQKDYDKKVEALTGRSQNDTLNSDMVLEIDNQSHHSNHKKGLELEAIDEIAHDNEGDEVFSECSDAKLRLQSVKCEKTDLLVHEFSED